MENEPKTDEMEEIEVSAEEGELWAESVVQSLQEEEDEEVLVQVKEPQVQERPAIHIGVICIEESPKLQEEVQESNECESPELIVVMEKEGETPIEGLELPIVEVEHIDFIGVDCFDIHPNLPLIDFFNNLRRIEVQHGLIFEEFWFAWRIKHRRNSKHLFEWHGRFQSSKQYSRNRYTEGWGTQVTHGQDSRTNLLQEEGNDMIQPSLKFNSAKEHNVFINEDSTMLMLKDWAWKFEGKVNEMLVPRAIK